MDEEENDPSIEELWAQLDRCDEHAKSDIYIELNIKLNIAERYLSALGSRCRSRTRDEVARRCIPLSLG